MTTVVFETSTIADSFRKASKCSPNSRHPSFTDCGGIYLMVRPGEKVVIRSTNLETFFTEWTEAVSIDGAAVDWRLPLHAAKFIAALPIGQGRTVVFDDSSGQIEMRDGSNTRTRATTPLLSTTVYPRWDPFSEADSSVVPELAGRLERVMWAAAKGSDSSEPELTGVYFDGSHIRATNRYRIAQVPCDIPVVAGGGAATIPAAIMNSIISHSGDVRMSLTEKGVGISPDEFSQIEIISYAKNFCHAWSEPREYDTVINVNCEEMVDVAQRINTIIKGASNPTLKLFIGNGEILFHAKGESNQEVAEDAVIAKDATHTPILISFDPQIFIDAFGRCPSPRADLGYNSQNRAIQSNADLAVYLNGGNGYESWFMQKKDV